MTGPQSGEWRGNGDDARGSLAGHIPPAVSRAHQPPSISERDFTALVIDLAHLAGWKCAHFRPCRTEQGWRTAVQADGVGFPDLVLVKGDMFSEIHVEPRLIFAELKVDGGRLRSAQRQWLEAFGWCADENANMPWLQWEAYVWRPQDIEDIKAILGVREAVVAR